MRRGTVRLAVGALFMIPTLSACVVSVFGVRGSGDVVTESRDVSGFDEVVLQGSGTVRIEVTGTDSLTIEAEDNLMEYLTSDVDSGRLELGAERSISPTEEIVYTITAASIEGMTISGSGQMTANGIVGDRLDAAVSGSGSVEIQAIEVDSVSVRISGSGSVEISGSARDLELSISGSGAYEGVNLITEFGSVTVSGSGDAVVYVTDQLEAEVSGSGNIEYFGDPSVDAVSSGSGNISKG